MPPKFLWVDNDHTEAICFEQVCLHPVAFDLMHQRRHGRGLGNLGQVQWDGSRWLLTHAFKRRLDIQQPCQPERIAFDLLDQMRGSVRRAA